MENVNIADPIANAAVRLLDEGNVEGLRQLLQDNPGLAGQRLEEPTAGYFKHPYLLWFIADNPIRRGKLSPNIVAIAAMIIDAIRRDDPDSLQEQIGYALGLVVTGRIPKECGVQAALTDLLIDAGATPGNGIGALAHGNPEAARHLIARGGEMTGDKGMKRGGGMTLAAAAGLGLEEEVVILAPVASREERSLALVVAAFYGRSSLLRLLIGLGVDLDAYPDQDSGFHTHATALHQAVCSGSLEAVQVLVEAGADRDMRDKVYGGTPLGWAQYAPQEVTDEEAKARYARIADYLTAVGAD